MQLDGKKLNKLSNSLIIFKIIKANCNLVIVKWKSEKRKAKATVLFIYEFGWSVNKLKPNEITSSKGLKK